MGDPEESAKILLKEELESLCPVFLSKLHKAKDFLEEGDLDALHLLAENLGTCCFKVKSNDQMNAWNKSVLIGSDDEQSSLLRCFLVLLWQAGYLRQVKYDPIDLRISPKQKVNQPDHDDSKQHTEPLICGNTGGNIADNSDDDDEAFTEDGVNYLIGPNEIDLDRKDLHHSLFATYRKSYERRTRHFLNSKHLPKARKLSGSDIHFWDLKFYKNVLEKAAASLEELNFGLRGTKELQIFQNIYMPKLRRLNLWLQHVDDEVEDPPLVFPPPLEDHVGLRYLRAHLPRPAFESLIQNNAQTLLELHLKVGTAHSDWDRWPMSCRTLHEILLCCKGTLRRLVLIRDSYAHSRASCQNQITVLKQNLPGLTVTCEYCCSK